MSDGFSRLHPAVSFLYFGLVLAFSMIFMHPVFLGISLVCGLAYSISLKGARAVRFALLFLLPVMLFTALLNPAFNHEGVTILTYLPDGNPLTLESMAYGLAAAAMLAAVVTWFSCFNAVITSDKFVYLFGRAIPALSLILSMVLRFVPRFKGQLKIVSDAQKCMGRDPAQGSIIHRARGGVKVLSIMITWALESAIETADSMKSRGYGLPGRTAFSIYRFNRRDKIALAAIFTLGAAVVATALTGGAGYRYFPTLALGFASPPAWVCALCYLALCLAPIIINALEGRKWKATQSAI